MLLQEKMRSKKIVDNAINRSEFNRAYKHYLEKKCKIHCSYCGYHRSENFDGKKWYGGFIYDDMETCSKRKGTPIRYPNWKLVSKKPKQWMEKPIRMIKSSGYNNKTYVEIKFLI